ncbi:hypothetical protein SAPIO_CDS8704 [Scedosporium apiospermum]|uniref:Uncharacterized protein n=1 Tax=Pseudallescheria apiosperma TaxID=563466 RepID=A0A084G089_PSEDA|nr:uncharacterized protein SAPIO_CDS8704 [Scedosporium apiospermum]KEZ40751.1 hypothetical protein SAPIO_CDS8704 [Scedosporium apiospermum]
MKLISSVIFCLSIASAAYAAPQSDVPTHQGQIMKRDDGSFFLHVPMLAGEKRGCPTTASSIPAQRSPELHSELAGPGSLPIKWSCLDDGDSGFPLAVPRKVSTGRLNPGDTLARAGHHRDFGNSPTT